MSPLDQVEAAKELGLRSEADSGSKVSLSLYLSDLSTPIYNEDLDSTQTEARMIQGGIWPNAWRALAPPRRPCALPAGAHCPRI